MSDYRAPINSSALHTYYSCLVTMPDCGLSNLSANVACGQLVSERDPQWHAGAMVLEGHGESVWSVAFSPDGKQIVSGSYDCTARVWDAVSGGCQHTLTGHTSSVKSVAFSPDGKQIVSGSEDSTVRVWDAVAGRCQHILTGHTHFVTSVAFLSDGSQIISGSWDHTVRVWELSNRMTEHGHEENSLKLRPVFSLSTSVTSLCIYLCFSCLVADPHLSR
jgi:WD40 repeat protein